MQRKANGIASMPVDRFSYTPFIVTQKVFWRYTSCLKQDISRWLLWAKTDPNSAITNRYRAVSFLPCWSWVQAHPGCILKKFNHNIPKCSQIRSSGSSEFNFGDVVKLHIKHWMNFSDTTTTDEASTASISMLVCFCNLRIFCQWLEPLYFSTFWGQALVCSGGFTWQLWCCEALSFSVWKPRWCWWDDQLEIFCSAEEQWHILYGSFWIQRVNLQLLCLWLNLNYSPPSLLMKHQETQGATRCRCLGGREL